MRQLLIATSCLVITACGTNYTFQSNVDKENFDNYLPAASVTIYLAEQIDPLHSNYLGAVEGVSCQEKENQAPPQAIDARNDLREQAAKLGANAVVIQQCYTIEQPSACIAMLSCFGKAYKI